MKTCLKCGEDKPLDEFYQHNGKYQFQCKQCSHKYQNALRRRKNIESNCVDCGINIRTKHKNHIRCKKCAVKHNSKKAIKRAAKWNKNNYGKRAAMFRKLHDKMPDWYIIDIYKSLGWKDEKITPDLITAKRALIKLKRAVKEIES